MKSNHTGEERARSRLRGKRNLITPGSDRRCDGIEKGGERRGEKAFNTISILAIKYADLHKSAVA